MVRAVSTIVLYGAGSAATACWRGKSGEIGDEIGDIHDRYLSSDLKGWTQSPRSLVAARVLEQRRKSLRRPALANRLDGPEDQTPMCRLVRLDARAAVAEDSVWVHTRRPRNRQDGRASGGSPSRSHRYAGPGRSLVVTNLGGFLRSFLYRGGSVSERGRRLSPRNGVVVPRRRFVVKGAPDGRGAAYPSLLSSWWLGEPALPASLFCHQEDFPISTLCIETGTLACAA